MFPSVQDNHVTIFACGIHSIRCIVSDNIMDEASQNGHVTVLEWWRDSGWEYRYSSKTMDRASANGHVAVLDWLLNYSQKYFHFSTYPLFFS
jgi:hypothetical protein